MRPSDLLMRLDRWNRLVHRLLVGPLNTPEVTKTIAGELEELRTLTDTIVLGCMGLKDWTIDPAPFTRLARKLGAFYLWPAERELRRRRGLVDRRSPVGDNILRLGTPPSLSDLIEAKLEALDARDRIALAAREDFRRGKGRPLTESQQAVLDYVRKHPHCESGDIAIALGRSKESVRQLIRRLRHRGLIAPETDPPTGYVAL